MRVIWIALLGVALLAGSAAGATKGGSVDLVAYSTPKDAYGKIISAFQKTHGRERTHLQPVLRRLRRPGARGRGRPAGRRRRALARARHRPARRQGPRPEELGREQAPRHRLRLGRRLRRARRQPEAHQGLGRPGQARRRGDHAEPVHLGRRALERHGRLRRAAQAPARPTSRRSPTCTSSSTTSPCSPTARATRSQIFAQGKGDVAAHLRERGDLRRAEGRAHRVQDAEGDAPDREAGRADQDAA